MFTEHRIGGLVDIIEMYILIANDVLFAWAHKRSFLEQIHKSSFNSFPTPAGELHAVSENGAW